jgi:hypothetical protein
MSSGGGSNQLPHDWHLGAMGISSELFELLLRHCHLASRGTIHSHDEIVWLALLGWT